ncbi:substrate-binding domain-containing protein [Dietzia kunjamensis]|uniref:LacI family DNA-binding transcriptional regulator n=1 Tax=Dietzia kunjamensis TaxID=322509 RepID=UPI002DBDD3B8|nr:substrate-binding domain-containing protein [Dietzia kunjamensis]MEB8326021.1 substrate-binding domain-containing protein [Dietzia kunjamensis]
MGKSTRPTMKDVASRSGVDVSVVSRVLSSDPKLAITPETRERVLAAVSELDYRPNRTARALRTSRSGLIAFVLPQKTSEVYLRLVAGAAARCSELGYQLVVAGLNDPETQLRDYESSGIDGVLLAAGGLDDDELRRWTRSALPVVAVNRSTDIVAAACDLDYLVASRLAGQHLVRLGHTRPAVLTGPWARAGEDHRLIGLCDELGVDAGELTMVASERIGAAAGYEAGLELADRLTDETAVFVTTISLAFGLLKALNERGFRVPEDLSVLTLHDEELANFTTPALTSVAMPTEQLGATAVTQLVDAIEGRPTPQLVVDGEPVLVARQSTAPVGTAPITAAQSSPTQSAPIQTRTTT